jgi:hypothetical protein
MGQISARVFECALMRTPMVLLRGRYSDALQPDVHYIAIEKDYSNVDAVLRRLVDTEELERMADRAYEHLVASGAFGYRAFWARLADIFSRRVAALASERQDPVAARSPAVAVAKPDASHPLFELPTQRVKSIDDYNRQLAAVAKIGLGAAASSAGLSTVKVVMPRRARFGLAVAMRRALTQAETKGALTPLDRVLLLAWYITPALIKRRVNPILAQIDYISR